VPETLVCVDIVKRETRYSLARGKTVGEDTQDTLVMAMSMVSTIITANPLFTHNYIANTG
jgi:hypothetical protein